MDHLTTHLMVYGQEDIGFARRGEAAESVRSGATGPDGWLPMNTNGGGLLYTHTDMYVMFALQEAVRQLHGRAAAHVPGPTTSLVQGVGGMFVAGTVVLQRQ